MISALGSVLPLKVLLDATRSSGGTSDWAWPILWLDNLAWMPIFFPIILLPLHFPTGRPLSARWGWINWLAIAMAATLALSATFVDVLHPNTLDHPSVTNSFGFIPNTIYEDEAFQAVWGIGLLAMVLGSIVSLVVRFRRAGIAERQQIRWLLSAGLVFFLAFVLNLVGVGDPALLGLALLVSVLGIPAAIAIAVFRYRLWDLDVVVNRALVYGLLTTLLAGLFAAGIAVTTEVGRDLFGEESRTVGAAISALVVAVVFQPLRDWIEGRVNRQFYPQKEDLASGLVEIQPEFWPFLDSRTLMELSMEHVRRVLGTPHAAFFLASGPGSFRLAQQLDASAAAGTTINLSERARLDLERRRVVAAEQPGALTGHVPIHVDRGNQSVVLGLLSIGARENGRGYSGDELKGLADLGGKIGLALRATQMGVKARST